MKNEQCPWKNYWQIKTLEVLYAPSLVIIGLIPAILIACDKNVLLAIVYFIIVFCLYNFLLNEVDKKMIRKWENKGNA